MRATPSHSATTTAASAVGLHCTLVASAFNGEIVERLVQGALELLVSRGADPAQQRVVWVPGALEIPLVVQAILARAQAPHAIICVGCVIKGGTDHYEHVCRATVDGIMKVSLDGVLRGTVVTNGVLTVATLAQALERSGGAVGNKGAEAALAAIATCAAVQSLGRV